MPYATAADLQARFGPDELRQLTDILVPRQGTTNAEVIAAALTDASAWLDSYIAGRYTLPVTDAGALARLKMDCCQVARYLLMTATPSEQAQKAFDQITAYYTAVAQAKINLIAPADVPVTQGAGTVQFDAGQKVFGRDRSSGGFGGFDDGGC